MSEPEDFIARWSRRKAEATEGREAPTETPAAEPGAGDEKRSGAAPEPAQNQTAPTAIDPATLPTIESIGVGTNISVFLRAGVPAEIARAALRRAWATDPNIRDFIGLAENAWDFTAPDGVPGFGPLSTADASRLMAEFTGKAKEAVERISTQLTPAEPVQAAPPPSQSVSPPISRGADKEPARAAHDRSARKSQGIIGSSPVQCNKENIAAQNDPVESVDTSDTSHPTRRTHGSALPE